MSLILIDCRKNFNSNEAQPTVTASHTYTRKHYKTTITTNAIDSLVNIYNINKVFESVVSCICSRTAYMRLGNIHLLSICWHINFCIVFIRNNIEFPILILILFYTCGHGECNIEQTRAKPFNITYTTLSPSLPTCACLLNTTWQHGKVLPVFDRLLGSVVSLTCSSHTKYFPNSYVKCKHF